MADFKMDLNTGRLVFTKNDLTMVTGIDAVKQAAFIRFKVRKGEWFLDPSKGIVDLEDLEPSLAEVRALMLSVPGVLTVESVEIERDQQSDPPTTTVVVSATCTDGPLDLRLPVIP